MDPLSPQNTRRDPCPLVCRKSHFTPSPLEKVLNATLLLVHVLQTVYQKKAEGFEKELVVAKQQNKRLKAKVENLRNQLEQNVSHINFRWINRSCLLE
jgi:hypothetical protein